MTKGRESKITQLKKGALELCVLCTLAGGDKYGYELVAAISRSVSVSEGTIYPLLKRIREDGYVRTYIQESSGGPARRYYALTPEGIGYKDELLGEWLSFVKGVNQIIEETARV